MNGKKYRRIDKTGLAPGSLVYLGDRISEESNISCFDYDGDSLEYYEYRNFQEYKKHYSETIADASNQKTHWIHINGVHNIEMVESIGKLFKINSLTLEDILSTDNRAKVEFFEESVFVILRFLVSGEELKALKFEQISFVLKKNVLITFSDNDIDVFDPIIKRLKNPSNKFLNYGADYLLYSIVDLIVDRYFIIIDEFTDQINTIEDNLIANADKSSFDIIKVTKRNLLSVLKNIRPIREVIRSLRDESHDVIKKEIDVYLRDVYDHIIQIVESVETLRDMTSSVLDIYLSSISNRTNEIMKVLTIMSSIFIPITFLSGVFGMNFDLMPELKWEWGYPLFWCLVVIVSGSLLIYFRKKKWI